MSLKGSLLLCDVSTCSTHCATALKWRVYCVVSALVALAPKSEQIWVRSSGLECAEWVMPCLLWPLGRGWDSCHPQSVGWETHPVEHMCKKGGGVCLCALCPDCSKYRNFKSSCDCKYSLRDRCLTYVFGCLFRS